jgi:DNA-binding NarL/FixJ family response regulator
MNKRTLKMLICDVHEKFSAQLSSQLSKVEFIELIGNTRTYAETVSILHFMEPDIILLDVSALPDQDPSAIHMIRKQHPGIRVVALTLFQNEIETIDLVRFGFDAAISRVCELNQITEELRKVYRDHGPKGKKLAA